MRTIPSCLLVLKFIGFHDIDSRANKEYGSSLDLFGDDDRFTILFDLDNVDLTTWASTVDQSSGYHIVGFTTTEGGIPLNMAGFECVVFKQDETLDDVYPLLLDSVIFVRPDGHVAYKYTGVPDVRAGRYIQSKIDTYLSCQ